MSDHEETEYVSDLSNPEVTTKYMTAAGIANGALEAVVKGCVAGAEITELCKLGDSFIESECAKVYNKKDKEGNKILKGIAFPTCVTPNNLHDHFSPLIEESQKLQTGDVIKVDLAVHIDGFLAAVAHTVVVGVDASVTDKRATVVQAAYTAAQAALRKVKVGASSREVSAVIDAVASEFGVKAFKGIHSYEYKQHTFDSGNAFPSGFGALPGSVDVNSPQIQQQGGFQFELNTVYGLDVIFTTGSGQPKETELRTTVFKRSHENYYVPKTQAGREFINEVNKNFPTLAFSLANVCQANPVTAKAGAAEARRHRLVEEFPVLRDAEGEFVAQFKFTLLLLPGGTKKVTGLDLLQAPLLKSDKTVQNEDLKALLATSANPKKLKKKN